MDGGIAEREAKVFDTLTTVIALLFESESKNASRVSDDIHEIFKRLTPLKEHEEELWNKIERIVSYRKGLIAQLNSKNNTLTSGIRKRMGFIVYKTNDFNEELRKVIQDEAFSVKVKENRDLDLLFGILRPPEHQALYPLLQVGIDRFQCYDPF